MPLHLISSLFSLNMSFYSHSTLSFYSYLFPLVQVLRQHINLAVFISFGVCEHFNLRNGLIGKRSAHHKAGVACTTTQVHQAALGQHDDVTLKVTLNLNPELTDWDNSEYKQAYFVSLASACQRHRRSTLYAAKGSG